MSKTQKYLVDVKDEIIIRDEVGKMAEQIRAYYAPDAPQKKLQTVVGLPGAGKSVLLKTLIEQLKEEEAYKSKFFCRIDISDCADEIEVYFKIASRLETHYKNNSNGVGQPLREKVLNQFMMLHDWIYGDAGKYPMMDSQSKSAEEIMSTMNDAIEQFLKNIEQHAKDDGIIATIRNGSWGEKFDIACRLLGKVTKAVPYVRMAKMLADLVVDNVNKHHLKNLLSETIEAFETKAKREEIFRELLIKAMPKTENGIKENPVIVLDNFQLVQNGDLGRNHTWLSKPDGLMGRLKAYWIIAGRISVIEHFENVFSEDEDEIEEEVQLQGFNEKQASDYLKKSCDNCFEEKEADEELKATVIEKMLAVCAMQGHDFVGNKPIDGQTGKKDIYYLPYLLNLVVIHFRRLCSDPAYTITKDSFVGLRDTEEFIGYYFYKDLSDLMTNAFQIISCLSTWDEQWIGIVRERFDNHLLNAPTVLFKTAPMEHLDGGRFKLHEGIKDGLFNTSTNYIKYDILRYLYEKFIEIYGSDEAEKQKEFWYQPERLQTFLEVVYKFIELMPDKVGHSKEIKRVVNRLYTNNKGRGNVTDSFIRLYSGYISSIKKFFHIPFVDIQNIELSDETLENVRNEIQEIFQTDNSGDLIFSDMEWVLYHMKCCFNLADLYTDMNLSGNALNLEFLCLYFWECMEKLARERKEGDEKIWRCRQQQIKAINAYAYDNSQEQNYNVAYKYGKMGLKMMQESATEISHLLEDKNIDISMLQVLIDPDTVEKFTVSTYKGIGSDIYEELKQGYRLLFAWKNDKTKEDCLQKILSDMLLVESQKLRGNFPWYCFHVQDSELNNEEYWKFGVRTYWMRRALLEVAIEVEDKDISNHMVKMFDSYHNVCVYLYKAGDVQEACILEHEVIEESEKKLSPKKDFDTEAQIRINTIKSVIAQNNIPKSKSMKSDEKYEKYEKYEKTQYDIFEYLWEKECGYSEETEDLKKHNIVLEQMQYMGDYYLHMEYYSVALRQFSYVTLCRYIRFGILDNKTMDSYLRLYVTAVACGEQEMCKLLMDYANEKLFTHEKKRNGEKQQKGCHQKSIAWKG